MWWGSLSVRVQGPWADCLGWLSDDVFSVDSLLVSSWNATCKRASLSAVFFEKR